MSTAALAVVFSASWRSLMSRKAKLTLADRVYQCDDCGLVMNRDVNAARNLLSLAASGADRVNACGAAVRPGLTAGRAVLKQEPGAADADQTGTAANEAAPVSANEHSAQRRGYGYIRGH